MDLTSRVTMAVMIAFASVRAFAASASAQTFVPVTEAMLASPDPADWLMMNRTFDEQRFSPLSEINTRNVGQLRMAWSRGLPDGTQESTPIVYRWGDVFVRTLTTCASPSGPRLFSIRFPTRAARECKARVIF